MLQAEPRTEGSQQSAAHDADQSETSLDSAIRKCNQAWQHGSSQAQQVCSALLEEANKLPDTDPRKARALNQVIPMYNKSDAESRQQSIDLLQRILALDEKGLGPEDGQLALDFSALGSFYNLARQLTDAEKSYKRATTIAEAAPKMNCFMRVQVFAGAASFYENQKKYAEAEATMRRAVELAAGLPPQQQGFFVTFRAQLAEILRKEGNGDDADRLLAEPVPPGRASSTPAAGPDLTSAYNDFVRANAFRDQGKLKDAELFYRHVIRVLGGADDPREGTPMLEADALEQLGELCHSQHRDGEAEEYLLRALDLREQTLIRDGRRNPTLAVSLGQVQHLRNFYGDQGRLSAMEPIYQRVLDLQEQYPEPHQVSLTNTLCDFAQLYTEENKLEQSLALFRRALQIQENHLGKTDPSLLVVLGPYADALEKLGRTAEAESLRARAQKLRNQGASASK